MSESPVVEMCGCEMERKVIGRRRGGRQGGGGEEERRGEDRRREGGVDGNEKQARPTREGGGREVCLRAQDHRCR